MKSLKYISIFALFLIFAFATGTAMAAKGGPKVDDDDICDDSRREENHFTLAVPKIGDFENDPTIWLRFPGAIGLLELCVELCEKVKGVRTCEEFTTEFEDCEDLAPGWFVAEDFGGPRRGEDDEFPNMPGSYQVTVFDSDCEDPARKTLGGDSFRVKD